MNLYLIQTGRVSDPEVLNSKDIFLGCTNTKFVSFNYMGSAEFECGASARSFSHIMKEYPCYKLFESYIQNANGVPLRIFCHEDKYEEIVNAIAAYTRKGEDADTMLKEPCYLHLHLEKPEPEAFDYRSKRYMRTNNNFWWDFQNHWIAFFGAQDRVDAFNRAIRNDRRQYLKDIDTPTYR